MTQFFKFGDNAANLSTRKAEAVSLGDALDVIVRVDDLIVKTDKLASFNKNEHIISAVGSLRTCREALVGVIKTPTLDSIPVELDSQAMEQSTPRFGK